MPASLLTEMNTQNGGLEDQRALQIALELTKLGLSENERGNTMPSRPFQENTSSESRKSPSTSSSGMCAEDVEVPSADHVAEIVGRQGCKIKALRAKTNTYIKTPVRGEPSVFQVTGKKEDVASAKREILSAAEHFTQIRASRSRNNHGPPSPGNHGQETIQVRVPYRVVGLVVGPKGATIKRIQQQTQTYIVTPSRDKEPIFEVTGLPDNVEKARQEILTHIAMRTGEGMVEGGSPNLTSLANVNIVRSRAIVGMEDPTDFHAPGFEPEFRDNERMGSMFKPPSANSAFTQYANALNRSNSSQLAHLNQQDNIFTYPNGKMAPDMAGFSALASTTAGGFYDSSDEGIGSSPSFDGSTMMPLSGSSIWSDIGSSELSLAMPCSASTMVGCYTDTLSSPPAVISPADLARLDNLAGTRLVSSDRGRSRPCMYSLPSSSSQVSSNTRGSASTSPTDSTESLGNPRRPCFAGNDPTLW